MLVPVSVPWAHVTLYYSAFFAANAILGMFGGWVGSTAQGNRVVEVEDGTPGAQVLRVHRKLNSPSRARGSHRRFWDFFYHSAASLYAWTPEHLLQALTPSTGSYAWQIVRRNEVNYDMFHAWSSSVDFREKFKPENLATLGGRIGLQLEATEYLIRLAQHFADVLSLHRLGMDGCGSTGTRRQVQRQLALQKPPDITAQSAFLDIVGTW